MEVHKRRKDPSNPPTTATSAPTSTSTPARSRSIRTWSLWHNSPRVLVYVLAVDVLAVALVVLFGPTDPVHPRDLVVLALLAGGGIVHGEAARHIERLREISADGRAYIDPKSMWSFAGLLLLPLGAALALVGVTWAYWWLRVTQRPVPHRWVFSAATAVLASITGWLVLAALPVPALHGLHGLHGLQSLPGAGVAALAAVVRWVVNFGLVIGVMSLSAPGTPWVKRLGSPTDNLLGLGVLALGIVLAELAQTAPWLIPVLLLPLLAMHRGFLVQQLARAAHTDTKTGLATAVHWQAGATRTLARARRRCAALGVLMIDLDDFKGVNDRHGHLVGDQVLRAVADVLRTEVGTHDAVGRFGGEEFVVLLTDLHPAQAPHRAGASAERLRERVTAIEFPTTTRDGTTPDGTTTVTGLSVSIGIAVFPGAADTIDDLLIAADAALYDAKHAGRNRVRHAPRV